MPLSTLPDAERTCGNCAAPWSLDPVALCCRCTRSPNRTATEPRDMWEESPDSYRARADARIAELERDQADWRKGVAFIASCVGDKNPRDLCAARIGEMVLRLRAELETMKGGA